jgi:signal transduction histidine kinase
VPAERERLWRLMEADLDELDGLIDSSLTYARFEREQPELHLTAVDIAPWLEEQVESQPPAGAQARTAGRYRALPPLLRVELDRKSMPYAITNLLRNAIKYAPGTRIRVSAEVLGDQIQVHVDDDGIGIPADERERVFSPSPASTVRATGRPAVTVSGWRSCSWSGTAWRQCQRRGIAAWRRPLHAQLAAVTKRH